jgi:ADP-ribosylglycohydrolase
MEYEILNGIMGLCVGDALGVPVEFKPREFLDDDPVTDMRSHGTYDQPAGTWSDDSSMALCLLDSLCGGLDHKGIMDRFIKWYRKGAFTPYGYAFDMGGTTRQALERYESGFDIADCGGKNASDNGNGSLMRILPIVFYLRSEYGNCFFEIDEAMDILHKVSELTHAHKRSLIACGIYCTVASSILDHGNLKEAVSLGITNAFRYYKSREGFQTELSFYKRLAENGFMNLTRNSIRSSGYVVDTLEAAVWCLLNSESYKSCVLKAVNLGEDTDTVAAVAGGLAGLHYGYSSIPEEWLEVIAKREWIEMLCKKLKAAHDTTLSKDK